MSKDVFTDLYDQLALEGYLISSKMEAFNFDKWKPGKHNILFITGLSGSGKTTLAEKMEKEYNAKMFELDGIDYYYDSSGIGLLKELEERCPTYAKIVKTQTVNSQHQFSYSLEEFLTIFNTLLKIMHEKSDTLFIVEGIQLIGLYDSFPFDEPCIIVGTSMIKSLYRRFNRTVKEGGRWSVILRNEFLQLMSFYIETEKKLRIFRKIIKSNKVKK